MKKSSPVSGVFKLHSAGAALTARLAVLFFCLCVIAAPPASAVYGDEPELSCKSAILYEANTKQVLLEKDADARIYPASTTKVMTALLALEHGDLNETVTVTKSALSTITPASSIAGLKVGEEMSLENLLVCMLVPSGNDAANVIAEHIGGTVDNFVDMMNKRAEELGCTNTHFANPSGLHDDNHYTTARDMLLITQEALKYPLFMEICNSSQATVPATNMEKERLFNTTNYLLTGYKTNKYLYPAAKGIKTGSTTPAGHCLISSAEKNNMYLISVVMGASVDAETGDTMSYVDTISLFDWAFASFTFQSILKETDPVAEVKVRLAQDKDYVVLHPNGEISALLHKDTDLSAFEKTVTVDEDVTAPIVQGQVLGKVTVTHEGKEYGSLDLVAMNDVQRSDVLYYFDLADKFFSKPWVRWGIAGFVLLIVFFTVHMVLHNRRRKRRAAMYRRRRY